MAEFTNQSVAKNCKAGEFENLDLRTRKKLLDVISRISEQSYRRGFQQGKELDKSVDAAHLRCIASRDWSPGVDSFHASGKWAAQSGMPLVERLMMEYGVLYQIGLGDC